jgi:hypothetical protein
MDARAQGIGSLARLQGSGLVSTIKATQGHLALQGGGHRVDKFAEELRIVQVGARIVQHRAGESLLGRKSPCFATVNPAEQKQRRLRS